MAVTHASAGWARHSWARRATPPQTAQPIEHKILPAPKAIQAHLLDDAKMLKAAKQAAAMLSERGYCVCCGGIDPECVADARHEVDELYSRGAMRPGGFTIAGRDDVIKAKRDDHKLWLHEYLFSVGGPEKGGASMVTALDERLARFGEAVARALSKIDRTDEPMGRARDGGRLHFTGRTDLMLACYPGGGAAYGAHIDNVDGDGREQLDFGRCLSLVYYLNAPDWDAAANGGSLRLHPSTRGSEKPSMREPHDVVDVAPRGDTLIMFRADRLLHEVRPARAKRYAATVWLYGGDAAAGAAHDSREARERKQAEQKA